MESTTRTLIRKICCPVAHPCTGGWRASKAGAASSLKSLRLAVQTDRIGQRQKSPWLFLLASLFLEPLQGGKFKKTADPDEFLWSNRSKLLWAMVIVFSLRTFGPFCLFACEQSVQRSDADESLENSFSQHYVFHVRRGKLDHGTNAQARKTPNKAGAPLKNDSQVRPREILRDGHQAVLFRERPRVYLVVR